MKWNEQTEQKMQEMVQLVVPEQFRDVAFDGLRTDAAQAARTRGASEIENQDLIAAIGKSPSFIQEALYQALKELGIDRALA